MPWLSILTNNWKLIAAGCLLAAVYFAGVKEGNTSTQAKWDAEKAVQQREAMEAMQAHAQMIHDAEVLKNEADAKNDKLLADLRTVRLRLPVCPTIAETSTPSGNGQAVAGTGTFRETAQSALTRFEEGVESDAHACDDVVEQARVMQTYLKSLNLEVR